MIRNIQEPGVEIREIDMSQYSPGIVGTYALVAGFADKGQELIPYEVASINDFEATFGEPSNEAERYFYYASREVLKNGGSLIAAKLPYNNDLSTNYKYIGLNIDSGTTITSASPSIMSRVSGYFSSYAEVSASTSTNISRTDYDTIAAGGSFPAGVSSYNFLVVNENKARISGPDENEGIFIVFVDPIDAMNIQRMLPNSSDTDVLDVMQGINSPSGIAYSDFGVSLTGQYRDSSISENIMKQFPTMEFASNGDSVDSFYAQHLGIIVCNTYADEYNEGKLNVGILEAFAGSIHKDKRDPATGQSIYLADIVNANSDYIKMYRNETIANTLPSETDTDVVLYRPSSEYPLVGFTQAESAKIIQGTQVANNIKTIHEKVSNIDEYQIDIVVDGGVSTIAQFTDDVTSGSVYNPLTDVDSDDTSITSSSDLATWRAVCNELIDFCSKTRKDCMCILDVPRHLVLEADSKFIRNTAPSNTFSNTIGTKLRYLTGLNSSYAALYLDWLRQVDIFTGIKFWIPQSVKMGGIYVFNDRVGEFWDAPFGLNRGVINGVNDLAVNPNVKEGGQIYIKSINYVKKYPLDGFVAWGQKTTQVKPSAFDRVNVRRMFLRLEREVYKVSRYFIGEPNNMFTRRRLVDILDPIFLRVKNAGGIFDYRIVCSTKNNTPDVIDRNELKIAVFIKPTKTAEFILADFIATRTETNFEEIIEELY